MRNTIKIFAIALVAVIGFVVVSCKEDDDGGDPIEGNTITSGAGVVYNASNLTEAKKADNFSFFYHWDKNEYKEKLRPLKDSLGGSPSVTINNNANSSDGSPSATGNNNKLTIILGTPKSDYLENSIEEFNEEDTTVTPNDAKFFRFKEFYTSEGEFQLVCRKGDTELCLIYVDRDVTINYTHVIVGYNNYSNIDPLSVSLKKGWNYLSTSITGKEGSMIFTYIPSATQPSGYKWTVMDGDRPGTGSDGAAGTKEKE